jgi:hypothetical protein
VGVIAAALAWLSISVVGAQFAAATGGMKPFDLQPGLKVAEIWAQLPVYTRESRRLYLRFFVLDFFLPLAAYGTVFLLWVRLFPSAAPALAARYPWVPMVPLVPMFCDWGENLGFLGLILAYPRQWHWLAQAATLCHWGKFAGMLASNVGLVVLALGAGLRYAGRSRS